MPIVCDYCKKPVEKKSDLTVRPKWGLFPKALHKTCWKKISIDYSESGSFSFTFGNFGQNWLPDINSIFYNMIIIVALVIGFILIFTNFLMFQLDPIFAAVFLIFVLILLIFPRIYSYLKFESQLT